MHVWSFPLWCFSVSYSIFMIGNKMYFSRFKSLWIVAIILGSSAKYLYTQQNNTNAYPLCSTVQDLARFANCPALQHQCEKDEKMKYYCPITCKFCEGSADLKVPSPPVKEKKVPKCKQSLYGCCKDGETEALGANFLACPETCHDTKNYDCAFYKGIGFCQIYKNQMLERCPLNCNFCKPLKNKTAEKVVEKVSECQDVWKTEVCERFRKFRICESEKWTAKMDEKCSKTCQKCKEHIPSLTSIASSCAANGDCCWDKTPSVNGICPTCKDSFSKNFCKRFIKDCNKNYNLKSVQIRILCPDTCGMCDTVTCKDDLVYGNFCSKWKELGECATNSDLMKTYCPVTCGMCP